MMKCMGNFASFSLATSDDDYSLSNERLDICHYCEKIL
jgi:hypothetical protein